jgi:hypothetical protein
MKAVQHEVRNKLDADDSAGTIIRKYYKLQKTAAKQSRNEGPF